MKREKSIVPTFLSEQCLYTLLYIEWKQDTIWFRLRFPYESVHV